MSYPASECCVCFLGVLVCDFGGVEVSGVRWKLRMLVVSVEWFGSVDMRLLERRVSGGHSGRMLVVSVEWFW
jgi:hypothetical protein